MAARGSDRGEARHRCAGLLGAVEASGSFSAKRTAAADDLAVEVRGVGALRFPVSQAQAKQLISVARPARYGLGAQTLLDTGVRDTWEVPKSRVRIDRRRWNKSLLPVLAGFRADLGLLEGCRLKAELQSMLVYAPGQFFAPHQDSEKADGMIGSLVVTLPAATRGGDLVVEHAGERVTYRPSRDRLSFVAFYADCRHEIRPLRAGYRVALTYNLLIDGDTTAGVPSTASEAVDAIAATLEEHFATAVSRPTWRRDGNDGDGDPPDRLVYLLDHEYTARALGWERVKGGDASRVAVLRAAADRAECEVALALVDVHETWSAFDDDDGWYRGSRSARWYGAEPDDFDDDSFSDTSSADDDAYELGELIDSEIMLEHWIDGSGSPGEQILSAVSGDEVCASTPSASLRPYSSEYEPYMGNYGNTMDRWYRRGAVVVWPRRRDFEVRAEGSPVWAIGAVAARLDAGELGEARELVARLAPSWDPVSAATDARSLFTAVLYVAVGVDDAASAAVLVSPFRVEMVTAEDAADLVALADRYGSRWFDLIAGEWARDRRFGTGDERAAWIESLPAICSALCDAGDAGLSTAGALVWQAWQWVADAVSRACALEAPSRRTHALDTLTRSMTAVLLSTSVIGAVDLRDEVLAVVIGRNDDILLPHLIGVLRPIADSPPETRRGAGFGPIAEHCNDRLEARVERPLRATDDWGIQIPQGCNCELCDTLAGFLADPVERTLEWPLNKDRRSHVHRRLDAAELPVRHVTRRTGRPYTLVLTKTDDLFEREHAQRRRDESDREWLRSVMPA